MPAPRFPEGSRRGTAAEGPRGLDGQLSYSEGAKAGGGRQAWAGRANASNSCSCSCNRRRRVGDPAYSRLRLNPWPAVDGDNRLSESIKRIRVRVAVKCTRKCGNRRHLGFALHRPVRFAWRHPPGGAGSVSSLLKD